MQGAQAHPTLSVRQPFYLRTPCQRMPQPQLTLQIYWRSLPDAQT